MGGTRDAQVPISVSRLRRWIAHARESAQVYARAHQHHPGACGCVAIRRTRESWKCRLLPKSSRTRSTWN